MKPCHCRHHAALLLLFAIFFIVSAAGYAAERKDLPQNSSNRDYQLFHLSRGYSKGFTEDPRLLDERILLRWGLPTPQLVFTSRAYNNAIFSYPQPGVDVVSERPVIVYVDKGYGQAIYSYPNNVGKGVIIGWPQEVD